ncbi:MAG: hypothetical protein ACR2NB_04960 [Solirubrobacteraceae bacterium]
MDLNENPPVHVTVAGSPTDPRLEPTHPGIVIHYAPNLHPEETVTLPSGLRVTSVARTLIDLASEMDRDELRATFERAREMGLLDVDAVHRSRARVEWRPSLEMLDGVIAEFSD